MYVVQFRQFTQQPSDLSTVRFLLPTLLIFTFSIFYRYNKHVFLVDVITYYLKNFVDTRKLSYSFFPVVFCCVHTFQVQITP